MDEPTAFDVAIVGAGLGGLAASIYLRQAGLQVVAIEPEPFPHARVGESLDWAIPRLLGELGVVGDRFVREETATYKYGIKVIPRSYPAWSGRPPAWFHRAPLRFETVTLNVDRVAFDQRLFERATELGVRFLWDRVTSVDRAGDRVVACRTAAGACVTAQWFLDNSGQAQVFPRAFALGRTDYGQRKVCVWTYFDDVTAGDSTTFYGENDDAYLTWIWEIAISPSRVSVGCVMPAERFRGQHAGGHGPADVLRAELAKHDRFQPLLARAPQLAVRTCSWRSYVMHRACGPNWLLVGESASLPDPLTSNGVTAAFRHAQQAAALIVSSPTSASLSDRQRRSYDGNVAQMGHAFNHSIETAIYGWHLRWGLGPRAAQRVYTSFGYLINAMYSRFRPQRRLGVVGFGILLHFVRVYMRSWSLVGHVAYLARPRPRTST